MKAKTVWEYWGFSDKGYGLSKIYPGKIFFAGGSDVRWVNCYGKEVRNNLGFSLYEGSKILGDGDSRRE